MKLLKVITFIPFILDGIILVIMGVYILVNGEMPIYGETNDPFSSFPTYLYHIKNLTLLLFMFLLFISPLLLLLTFITNEFSEKRKVVFYLFLYMFGWVIFVFIRNTMFFTWLLD